MEELIKTANIYYILCSPAVKDAAHKFFKDIDHDNDGKVSLHEFLEFMRQEGHEKMSSREFFETLNKKRNGTLGFAEVLALFYIIQSGRPFCHGCDVFIAGTYFTCSECYQSDNNSNVIFVCPKCFEKGSYIHSHERNQFLDNYALLALMGKRGIARPRTHSILQRLVHRTSSKVAAPTTNAIVPYAPSHHGGWHKWKLAFQAMKLAVDTASLAEMEELINTVNIYYKSCSPAVRDAAHKFFKDIDHDNDGKVSLHEFLEFMRQEGHEKMSSRDFFKILDKKRNGTLGFEEVLVLFYIIQSGRPFCYGCDVFIAGMYFTCSECYQSDNKNNVFFLCPKCFEKGSYIHSHERNQFLDNYALLALKGKRGIARPGTHSIQQLQERPPLLTRFRLRPQPTSPEAAASTTNAIVPYAPPHDGCEHKWELALQVMKLAVATANLGSNCVVNLCTIM